MKFFYFLSVSMLGLMVCGCSDGVDTPKNLESGLLSSDEQTAKLQSVSYAALNLIDAQDHSNVIDLVGYYKKRYAGYEVDNSYFLHVMNEVMQQKSPIPAVDSYMRLLDDMASKNVPSMDYQYYQNVLAFTNIASLYGEFSANDSLMMWQYIESTIKDRLQLSYVDSLGRDVVVTLKGSGPTTTVRVDYSQFDIDSTINYQGNTIVSNDTIGYYLLLTLPERIVFSVSVDDTQIASLTFVTSMNCDIVADYYNVVKSNDQSYEYEEYESSTTVVDFDMINMAVIMDLNNYQAKIDWLLEPDTASIGLGIIIKNQSIISLDAKLGGQFDEILNGNYSDVDNSDSFYNLLSSFDLNIDVMGQVQVKGFCSKSNLLAKLLMEPDQNIDVPMPMKVIGINEFTDLNIYFDDENDINSSVYLKYYPKTASEEEYVTPVIEFMKDNSVLQCSEFFEKEKYNDLINLSIEKAFGLLNILDVIVGGFK